MGKGSLAFEDCQDGLGNAKASWREGLGGNVPSCRQAGIECLHMKMSRKNGHGKNEHGLVESVSVLVETGRNFPVGYNFLSPSKMNTIQYPQ